MMDVGRTGAVVWLGKVERLAKGKTEHVRGRSFRKMDGDGNEMEWQWRLWLFFRRLATTKLGEF